MGNSQPVPVKTSVKKTDNQIVNTKPYANRSVPVKTSVKPVGAGPNTLSDETQLICGDPGVINEANLFFNTRGPLANKYVMSRPTNPQTIGNNTCRYNYMSNTNPTKERGEFTYKFDPAKKKWVVYKMNGTQIE